MQVVDKIRETIRKTGRWPEIVTYEEMNLKSPWEKSPILHVLHRVIFKQTKQGKRKRLLHRAKSRVVKPKPES
jgi:hypothetical protein